MQEHHARAGECDAEGDILDSEIRYSSKRGEREAGVSGGKATGAILTLGTSLLAKGLSRKEEVTEAHCCNCDSTGRGQKVIMQREFLKRNRGCREWNSH
jgi:hypothetical protein